ncbi:MAG: hypothetical protein A2X86_13670 [Bdellovibrionales bacterium GWA2_49_15]|nr:MAG: hypothetical protein A2X86_13670 [Bdellovibrionales bacterium GWA2_49_15]HAZ13575.1 DUF1015 domain-containing protein [Bdellovibrionales bacterium]
MNTIGVKEPVILLPKEDIDLNKWAVVACDQYTGQPEYWREVEKFVGDAPSTNNLIFPEVWLGQDDEVRIARIQKSMRDYLERGLFKEHKGFILVERSTVTPHGTRTRMGIMVAADLEHYDYNKGPHSLTRATEGTILDRIPPRVRIRQGAPLEVPHIMLLVDDPEHTVIKPITAAKGQLKVLYNTELMMKGGHICGYAVDAARAARMQEALAALANPESFRKRYGLTADQPVLLYAVGDGNHSLATAKAVWENLKKTLPPAQISEHPARYALVELVNVHDEGLEFEPIHRVLFNVQGDFLTSLKETFKDSVSYINCSRELMMARVGGDTTHRIGLITAQGHGILEFARPTKNLPVATIQEFLDPFMKSGGAHSIDYVHGDDVVCELGARASNVGLYLPSMNKDDLFKTVLLDGVLPRKTFSMGEANEKRYYLECRKIL